MLDGAAGWRPAGHYVSAPCRWIVANDLTITGSIGNSEHLNYRGLMDKVGLQPETFKSGRHKDMLSGLREPGSMTEERDMVQALINETYAKFTNVVVTASWQQRQEPGEGRALSKNWPQHADGRILSGTEAFKLGFVDELGTLEDAVRRAKSLAGIRNANLIKYQRRYDLSDLFQFFGQTERSWRGRSGNAQAPGRPAFTSSRPCSCANG